MSGRRCCLLTLILTYENLHTPLTNADFVLVTSAEVVSLHGGESS